MFTVAVRAEEESQLQVGVARLAPNPKPNTGNLQKEVPVGSSNLINLQNY